MRAWFEIWDVESRNLLATHDSEAAALAFISEAVADEGQDAIRALALASANDRGQTTLIAEGDELVERAARLATA